MPRLLFEKTGNAVWMSHLDLMRLFQRAFKRAGLPLKHTQGFNPRPSVSIAMPLSVGVESLCELLDFELDGVSVPCNEIAERLNKVLVPGVKIMQTYETGRKLRELAVLACTVTLQYDAGVPNGAREAVCALFTRESLVVSKKSKNGIQEQDIIPMIRELSVKQSNDQELVLEALVCCQNPTLNPMQLTGAVEFYLPALKPDFSKYCRVDIYDQQGVIFR